MFTHKEIALSVCGIPELDINLLKNNCVYNECSLNDPHVQWFWKILSEMDSNSKSLFLRFVTGRARLSNEIELDKKFEINKFFADEDNVEESGASPNVDHYMPRASTCFSSLQLPAYSSEQIMREKLLYAIRNCVSIDNDFVADVEEESTEDDNF